MTVVEVIGSECSDSESDAQCATASSVPTASSATSTWEDMNYAGQREQFIDNYGPQNGANSARNKHLCSTKIQSRGFIPLCSRMRDWKPVTKDEMYVVLALFMPMGLIQKPTLSSYFSKKYILATPIFGSNISMGRFESICNFLHFNYNGHVGIYQEPYKLFKIFPFLSHLNTKFQRFTYLDRTLQ